MDEVIDINFYPTDKTETSNSKHRPIGLGIQGLADVFFELEIAYDSEEAKDLNKLIFETIYFGALEASNELAKEKGAYSTFKGSPLSQGKFQFDMWRLNLLICGIGKVKRKNKKRWCKKFTYYSMYANGIYWDNFR